MSKLDDLIKELCPNGVEYETIKSVYTRLRGTTITATKMKHIANDNGDIRVFAGGKTVINAFEKDIPNANITRVPAVLVQSRGIIDFIFFDKPFTFKNEMWAYTHKEIVSVKFLYYVLKNNAQYFRDAALGMGAFPQISLSITEDFKIPVPPLEIQREIVQILDNFTELTAELTTELTARKQQYEYYRDSLLSFREINSEEKTLAEIANFKTGTKPDKILEDYTDNAFYYVNAGTTPSGYVMSTNKEGDTVTTPSRGQGGIGFVGYQGKSFWLGPLCYGIRTKNPDIVTTKYIYHCLCNQTNDILARKKEGGTPSLNSVDLGTIKISIPCLETQHKVVDVLDNFEAICNDFNIGLPAEIEARKQQYEFYRDLLLTFVETGNTILTDRQTDRQSIIKLLQYVFGFAYVGLEDISDNCDAQRKPVTKGHRSTGKYPYYGASGIVDYVSDYIYDGDFLLISEDGANLAARVTPIAFSITGQNWVNNHAHVLKFRDIYEQKYVEMYLNGMDLTPYISGAAQPKLNQKNMNAIRIPLPAPEETRRIVDILSQFDKLCSDITEGLPAEISARQQQYEYYRDKLLTFKEK